MKIFISYRREDSASDTGRIDDRLVAAFGRGNVYKDVDSVPIGADFPEHIRNAVGQCDVLLVVIGGSWLNASDGTPNPRLMDPLDWVRLEIETALERKIPVVPIVLGQTTPPSPSDLPESLKQLAYKQAIAVRPDPDFHRDIDRLIEGLKDQRWRSPKEVAASIRDRFIDNFRERFSRLVPASAQPLVVEIRPKLGRLIRAFALLLAIMFALTAVMAGVSLWLGVTGGDNQGRGPANLQRPADIPKEFAVGEQATNGATLEPETITPPYAAPSNSPTPIVNPDENLAP
jgi:hypothetical protein